MKSTTKAIFEQKPQNQSNLGQIILGIQLQTFPSMCNTRKTHSKIWNIALKNHSLNGINQTYQKKEVKEKLLPVSFFYVWAIFEHQVKDTKASQKVQDFF